MSFDTDLADYTAAQIIAALGCQRSTAYEWLAGRRQPPVWQQAVFLKVIAAHTKKSNKTSERKQAADCASSRCIG